MKRKLNVVTPRKALGLTAALQMAFSHKPEDSAYREEQMLRQGRQKCGGGYRVVRKKLPS